MRSEDITREELARLMGNAAEDAKTFVGHGEHDGFAWSIDGLFCGCGSLLWKGWRGNAESAPSPAGEG